MNGPTVPEMCDGGLVEPGRPDDPRFLGERQVHVVNMAADGSHGRHVHHGTARQTDGLGTETEQVRVEKQGTKCVSFAV